MLCMECVPVRLRTWTLKKADKKRIDALEMWIWRKMENIKWTDKITNEEVLLRVGETHNLRETISMRKKRWMGHVLRREGLMKDVLEGRMEGKRLRGRKRIMMMDDIKDGRSYSRTKRDAEDKELWRGAP